MTGECNEFMPMYAADSPYLTAVGSRTGLSPEIGAGLSSGGFSHRWVRPSWQAAAVQDYLSTAANLPVAYRYNSSGRAFPDVSAQGTIYVVINNGQTLPSVAGTSASSPSFGGVIAMLNDARIAAGSLQWAF